MVNGVISLNSEELAILGSLIEISILITDFPYTPEVIML